MDAAAVAAAPEPALVGRFWAFYQARRWGEALALLAPEAQCRWWASRERFEGAAAIVHVNAVYPEGWRLHLLALNPLGPGRVHSLLRVDHGAAQFYANSFFELREGLIVGLDEYWSDVQAPPAWRAPGLLPGCAPLVPDDRPGLDLLALLPPESP